MSDFPDTWAKVTAGLAELFGGRDGEPIAQEWIREALERCFGAEDLLDLPRVKRQVALQRSAGVLLTLRDGPDPMFMVDVRAHVAAVFSRFFDGVAFAGPPWRLDPYEQDKPTYAEWVKAADFEACA